MTGTAVQALDPAATRELKSFRYDRQLTRCRFSPCGTIVVAGGLDGALQSWHLETGERSVVGKHSSWIGDIAVHPGGELLYACDYHGGVRCWSYPTGPGKPGNTVWAIREAHRGWVRCLAADSQGRWLASGGDDGVVRLWSADTGKLVRAWSDHEAHVASVAFHPDGARLATGDLLGVVRDRDCETGATVRSLDASLLHTREEKFLADVGGVRCLAFDAAGEALVASGLANAKNNTFCPGAPTAIVFDWSSGKRKKELRVSAKADGYLNAVRFLGDSSVAGIAEGAAGGALCFWKPGDEKHHHALKESSGYDIDLHPDGRHLAAALHEPHGRSGNGRHVKKSEYFSHAASVKVFALYPEPPKDG